MIIRDDKLGECEVEIHVDSFSAVDSHIESGSSITLDRDLNDGELDYLNEKYTDLVQEYSYENGSRNHN